MVVLSESVMKNCLKRTLAEDWQRRHIRLAIKPHYLANHTLQIKSYYVTLLESHGCSFRIRQKIRMERPLVEKSWRRYIPLAIKPHYLGNHAWQLKSNYRTLSGSHDRSFRIRHEKSRRAPLAEKSWWRHIRIAIKPHWLGNHASQIKSYYGTLWGSHGRTFRIHNEKLPEAPPGGGLTKTSYPVGNKTSLSRKPCITDKKLLWITIMKSWSLSNLYKKNSKY